MSKKVISVTIEGEMLDEVKAMIEEYDARHGWEGAYLRFLTAVQLMDKVTADAVARRRSKS